MHTKGPLDLLVTSGSVVGGATRGLRNGFDVAPRGARAPHARPRARPFPVTARFGHPLLENRFPQHLFGTLSLGELGQQLPIKLPALHPVLVRFLDKSKIWLELRVGIAFAYHTPARAGDAARHRDAGRAAVTARTATCAFGLNRAPNAASLWLPRPAAPGWAVGCLCTYR